MADVNIKQYLKSKTLEEINSLTMDVSKSFLNGCTCSPLAVTPDSGMLSKALNSALASMPDNAQDALSYVQDATAYGYKLYQNSITALDQTIDSLNGHGIYINRDGKKINVQTDFVPHAINIGLGIATSVKECVVDEAKEIVNSAVKKIIEFPDPQYFISYLTTYFGVWLNSDECKEQMADIISAGSAVSVTGDNKPVDSDEKVAEVKSLQCSQFLEKVSYTCQTRIPEIGNWINDKTQKMVEYTAMASSYAAFGEQWVSDSVNKYVNMGIEHIEDYVDLKVEKILNIKQNVIDFVCKNVTDSAINYHKKLMQDAQKLISKEVKSKIQNAELKAKMAVINAASKVCSKFGVPVPEFDDILATIDKAKLADYTKKIADLASGNLSALGSTGKIIDIVRQFSGNILGNAGNQSQQGNEQIRENESGEEQSAEITEETNDEANAVSPNYLPTKEGEVGYGEDGSRWVSYKYKKKIQNNVETPSHFGIDVLQGIELELYAWTLVATAEQEKERYGDKSQEERPLTDAEKRLQEAQARGLAETGVSIEQVQAASSSSSSTDASNPVEYLVANKGMDKKTAQTKWNNALKSAKRMVSAHIRAASYAPGWGQLSRKPKLKSRVIDAQARMILQIPCTDQQAMNILNGRG